VTFSVAAAAFVPSVVLAAGGRAAGSPSSSRPAYEVLRQEKRDAIVARETRATEGLRAIEGVPTVPP
jgi:hypothetical protein